jgi:hypothetical protein
MSESDAAGLDKDDLVVATGDVGTELNPLEFPRCAASSLLYPCFARFLLPKVEVAVADSFPFSNSTLFAASPPSALPASGAFDISSPSLLSSCLIDFRIFEGEWPSFPDNTMVSASESLFTPGSSGDALEGSRSITTSFAIAGGDDPMPFGVLAAVFFTPSASATRPDNDGLSLAVTASALS